MTDLMDEDDAQDATDEAKQPVRSLDAQRTELDKVRQQVAANDEKTDTLQVRAPRNKRKWYHEPSVLVSTLALVVSVSTSLLGQANVTSDRQIQDRNRLTALIEQLPIAQAQAQATPGLTDLVGLVAGSAAALIDKLKPEESTANEKIEVAAALLTGSGDLPSAKRLATEAEQQW